MSAVLPALLEVVSLQRSCVRPCCCALRSNVHCFCFWHTLVWLCFFFSCFLIRYTFFSSFNHHEPPNSPNFTASSSSSSSSLSQEPLTLKLIDFAPAALPLLGVALSIPPTALTAAAGASFVAGVGEVALLPDDNVLLVALQVRVEAAVLGFWVFRLCSAVFWNYHSFFMLVCLCVRHEAADLFTLAYDSSSPVILPTINSFACLVSPQTFLFILLSGVVPAAAVVGAKVLGSGSNA